MEKHGRAKQAIDGDTGHAHCMLDDYDYRHTFIKRNTYCFSTRMGLNVTSVLPVLFNSGYVFAVNHNDANGIRKIVKTCM